MKIAQLFKVGFLVAAVGCGGTSDEFQEYTEAPLSAATDMHDHGEHAGLHGGHIIEIGDAHAAHLEMVFDKETRDISLYFYGAEVGQAVAASGVEFEIEVGGEEVSLEVKASPLEGETEESASRYVVSGTTLPKEITSEEQLDGHLHVTIGGQEYAPSFHAHSHDEHDHDGHDHDHDEHDHKEGEAAHGDDHDHDHGDDKK